MRHDTRRSGSSKFARVGREAMHRAQRALLLDALEREGWCLARAGRSLGLGGHCAPVLRAIRCVGLTPEYERARRDGLVRPGRREPVHA